MTQRKKITLGVVALLIVLVVLSALLPVTYETTVKMKVEAPVNVAFNAVKDRFTMSFWYHRLAKDSLTEPHMWADVSQPDSEWFYSEGVIRLVSAAANDSILIYDEDRQKRISKLKFKFIEENPDQTILQVSASGQSPVFAHLFNFLHRWTLHRQIKKDVKKLILVIEDRVRHNKYFGYEIKAISVPEKFYITRRDSIQKENLTDFYKQNVALLYQSALDDNLAIQGMPVVLKYESHQDSIWDVAVGLPTLSEVHLKYSSVQKFPTGMAYQIVHEGHSTDTQRAHQALKAFFTDKKWAYIWPVVEEYPSEYSEKTVSPGHKTFITYYPKS